MSNLTKYKHRFIGKSKQTDLPVGKVLCVGRNYLDHIKELGNEVPSQAIYFIKPSTSLCDMNSEIAIPTNQGECHNELELAFLIADTIKNASPDAISKCIAGLGLGLDLTLRDEQNKLKAMGHPWERAKAFDGACPISQFCVWDDVKNTPFFEFSLNINNEQRQQGDSRMMMRPVFELIADMSQHFTLEAGDIVLTGTPKGLGPLNVGDRIDASLSDYLHINTSVVAA